MEQTLDHTESRLAKRLSGRQIKYLIGGIVIVAAVAYMIVSAAGGAAAYYMTIAELEAQGPSKKNVRVSGNIVGETIVWEPRDLRLRFEIADASGQMPVRYQGARPDMFRDEAELVVEGKYTAEGHFEARTMLLKCPSKYEEAD